MKIEIKDFNVNMELGSEGIELQVNNNDGSHIGDIIIGNKHLTWYKGRKGKVKDWSELIDFFES